MKYYTYFPLIILIAILIDCTSIQITQKAKLNIQSIENWPDIYKKNYSEIKSIQSKARITVESSNYATSFDAQMIFTAPDILFIKAEGPFGIDVGKIFIGKNRFILYNQFNNQFFSASLEDEYFNTFLQTNLSFKQIKSAFIGYSSLPENIKLIDEQNGVFTSLVNSEKWRYIVDVKTGLLQKFEIISDDQILLRQEFNRYIIYKGIVFPGLVRITQPERNEMVAVAYKNLNINEELDKSLYYIEISPQIKQLIVSEKYE
jgi:outer membrane lipoprotein-sorting protein